MLAVCTGKGQLVQTGEGKKALGSFLVRHEIGRITEMS